MDNKVQKNINSNKTKGETKFKVNIKGNKDVKMELLDFYNHQTSYIKSNKKISKIPLIFQKQLPKL